MKLLKYLTSRVFSILTFFRLLIPEFFFQYRLFSVCLLSSCMYFCCPPKKWHKLFFLAFSIDLASFILMYTKALMVRSISALRLHFSSFLRPFEVAFDDQGQAWPHTMGSWLYFGWNIYRRSTVGQNFLKRSNQRRKIREIKYT